MILKFPILAGILEFLSSWYIYHYFRRSTLFVEAILKQLNTPIFGWESTKVLYLYWYGFASPRSVNDTKVPRHFFDRSEIKLKPTVTNVSFSRDGAASIYWFKREVCFIQLLVHFCGRPKWQFWLCTHFLTHEKRPLYKVDSFYRYDSEEPKYDYNNPGFTPETGHFTQVNLYW